MIQEFLRRRRFEADLDNEGRYHRDLAGAPPARRRNPPCAPTAILFRWPMPRARSFARRIPASLSPVSKAKQRRSTEP
jgi:hypothetical protein